jgi:hypothetical protein
LNRFIDISEIPSRDIYESIQIQQDLIFVKSWLLRSRVNNGSSGYHLITSYKDNENNQILINKGWIPLSSTLDDVGNESNETYIGILLEYDIKPSIGQDALKNSDYLFENINRSIAGIKYGLKGEITVNDEVYDGIMVTQGLDDEEIADVMNYILNSWGSKTNEIITKERVAKILK